MTTLTDDPVSPEDYTHLGLLGDAYALSEAPLKIGELGAYYLHATSLSELKKRNIGNVIQRDLDRDDNLSIQHGRQHTLAHHLRKIQQDAYLKHLAPNTGRQESFERKKLSVPVSFELRDYQQDCVGQLEAEHNQEDPRDLVLKLPTGAGKSTNIVDLHSEHDGSFPNTFECDMASSLQTPL